MPYREASDIHLRQCVQGCRCTAQVRWRGKNALELQYEADMWWFSGCAWAWCGPVANFQVIDELDWIIRKRRLATDSTRQSDEPARITVLRHATLAHLSVGWSVFTAVIAIRFYSVSVVRMIVAKRESMYGRSKDSIGKTNKTLHRSTAWQNAMFSWYCTLLDYDNWSGTRTAYNWRTDQNITFTTGV